MKKRTRGIPLLSRKAKTLIYSSICLLVLTAIIAGNFPITPWNAFRLAEKARLVGPATILGTESVVSAGQDAVIIAETEEFCMTYGYKFLSFNDTDNLVCKKRTGDLTFLSIAPQSSFGGKEDEYCSIILFDDYPQAVRATLTLQPYMYINSELYQGSYAVTATRWSGRYFFFHLDWREQANKDKSGYDPLSEWGLIASLQRSLNSNATTTYPVPGKIQLYDKDGNIILEREIDLQKPYPQ